MRNQKRKKIVLCGSSRYKETHEEAQAKLGLAGHIVIPMSCYGHRSGLDMESQDKKDLDDLHLDKIDCADAIYVVNPQDFVCYTCGTLAFDPEDSRSCVSECCGTKIVRRPYIGDSTRREILYAGRNNKEILYHVDPGMIEFTIVTHYVREYRRTYKVQARTADEARMLVLPPADNLLPVEVLTSAYGGHIVLVEEGLPRAPRTETAPASTG